MNDRDLTRLSRALSRYLRHAPHELGLTLEPGGWVRVRQLLRALAAGGNPISPEELRRVVEASDKQRFSFDASGERIRANQGHSVAVDLQLEPLAPPAVLYHGTGANAVAAILSAGLLPMRRRHVHLSANTATARMVGARHGPPVVLEVAARRLHTDGAVFYRSENGVWLVDRVPAGYLRVLQDSTKRA